MKGAIVVALLTGCAAACSYGMTAEKFRPARSPRGIETRITTSDTVFAGELIEVRETGLVLLSETLRSLARSSTTETADRRLRLIPYAAVVRSQFEQLDAGFFIMDGRMPTDKGREQLRLVSRFPQGLSPEVLSRLLEAHGQTELVGIRP
jgi:hypothetical protein